MIRRMVTTRKIRKMVRRKFKALPWNRHNKTTNTEEIPEQKINKIVEDNSVMLEKINHVSTICDSLLETFYTMADNNEIDFEEEDIEEDLDATRTNEFIRKIRNIFHSINFFYGA